ncbi:MAG: hypothetical protein KAS67_01910 [Thermoplasmata archaeon]|nr:hypothetical protein [Thermoplasmata archaeon]
MRNERLKYGGLVSIIGIIILAGSALAYYLGGRPALYVDTDQFQMPLTIGIILLVGGLLLFIFIDE